MVFHVFLQLIDHQLVINAMGVNSSLELSEFYRSIYVVTNFSALISSALT